MWEVSYGKEPFDLRLTLLRLLMQWKSIILWIAAGTILFTGGYYVKNVVLSGAGEYCAESRYRIDYSVEDEQVGAVMINSATWDIYVHTDEFLEYVESYLGDTSLTREQLREMIQGDLESDWRVPRTRVTGTDRDVCERVAKAVENTMVEHFADGISEINDMRVIDYGTPAMPVDPDVRVFRAFVLGVVLSVFFVFLIYLVIEIGSDAIWLPATIRHRYGLKVLGTLESSTLTENISHLFADRKRVCVCPVQKEINPKEVTEALRFADTDKGKEWVGMPSVELSPEGAARMREADGILLLIEAGCHAGKQTEEVLEFLDQQDCKVTAVLLCDADEQLIRFYYGRRK